MRLRSSGLCSISICTSCSRSSVPKRLPSACDKEDGINCASRHFVHSPAYLLPRIPTALHTDSLADNGLEILALRCPGLCIPLFRENLLTGLYVSWTHATDTNVS